MLQRLRCWLLQTLIYSHARVSSQASSAAASQGCCSACAAVGRRLGSTVSSEARKSAHPWSAAGTRAARLVRFGRSTSYAPCSDEKEENHR